MSQNPRRASRSHGGRRFRVATAFMAGACLAGCHGSASGPDADTIDSETFISSYVDLRAATVSLDTPGALDSARTAILARHGVTQQDLLTFADVHGEDATFMRAVWDEVERRLDAARPDSLVTPH
jgi:hypothetical protein